MLTPNTSKIIICNLHFQLPIHAFIGCDLDVSQHSSLTIAVIHLSRTEEVQVTCVCGVRKYFQLTQ